MHVRWLPQSLQVLRDTFFLARCDCCAGIGKTDTHVKSAADPWPIPHCFDAFAMTMAASNASGSGALDVLNMLCGFFFNLQSHTR
jgi:hypothetical protein